MMTDPDPDAPPTVDTSDGVLRCAGCGVRARIVNGVPVNAEPRPVSPWCLTPTGRRRSHGPFIPSEE